MKCHTSVSISLYCFLGFSQAFLSGVTRCVHPSCYKTQEHSLCIFRRSVFALPRSLHRHLPFTRSTKGHSCTLQEWNYTPNTLSLSDWWQKGSEILPASLLHTPHPQTLSIPNERHLRKKEAAFFLFTYFTFQVRFCDVCWSKSYCYHSYYSEVYLMVWNVVEEVSSCYHLHNSS